MAGVIGNVIFGGLDRPSLMRCAGGGTTSSTAMLSTLKLTPLGAPAPIPRQRQATKEEKEAAKNNSDPANS